MSDEAPIKDYAVKAEVQFSVKATSIAKAYKQFETWIIQAFSDAYDESKHPIIVPNFYEGISVTKVQQRKGPDR